MKRAAHDGGTRFRAIFRCGGRHRSGRDGCRGRCLCSCRRIAGRGFLRIEQWPDLSGLRRRRTRAGRWLPGRLAPCGNGFDAAVPNRGLRGACAARPAHGPCPAQAQGRGFQRAFMRFVARFGGCVGGCIQRAAAREELAPRSAKHHRRHPDQHAEHQHKRARPSEQLREHGRQRPPDCSAGLVLWVGAGRQCLQCGTRAQHHERHQPEPDGAPAPEHVALPCEHAHGIPPRQRQQPYGGNAKPAKPHVERHLQMPGRDCSGARRGHEKRPAEKTQAGRCGVQRRANAPARACSRCCASPRSAG
ncbi:hypothetical protein LMG18090_02553 [Ralstonia mannitolilytica]|nr:hypothetical protein LMG18090_02553 [Ralstonia mannitolilytica]